MWSMALVSGTSRFYGVGWQLTPVMLRCYKLMPLSAKKQFENNKQHTFNCIDYIGSLPVGRNALVARTNQSEGGCSDPTPVMLRCYKKFYLPKRQFENNKQHTYNGIDCIGRMTKWSKVMVSGSSHFHVTVFQFIFL